MMARKPLSRSKPPAPRWPGSDALDSDVLDSDVLDSDVLDSDILGASSDGRPRLASALSPAVPAMIQIRRSGAITSMNKPHSNAPTTKAADPHNRSGP